MFKSIWDDITGQFRRGNIIMVLIWICIAVFLVFETLRLFYWSSGNEALYYNHIYKNFALPMNLSALVRHPWSLISGMFMHAGLLHIAYNLIALYWCGEIYNLYMQDKRALPLFIFGSIAGSILAIILYHIFPPLRAVIDDSYLVGASAGLFSIMFAATALNPEHRVHVWIIGEVALKYVAAVCFLVSYVTIASGNAGGMIAHVGGAVFGYLYIRSLRAGTDWFSPLDRMAGLFNRSGRNLKATHVRGKATQAEKKDLTSGTQKRLDDILDKISKSGYNSLSKEEKEFLFKYSDKQ